MVAQPTSYPDVNEVLGLLLSNVKEILGEQLVGMYLYGSLSSGDFDPHSSDIDFVVVTEDVLPPETVSALEAMHKNIWAGGLKKSRLAGWAAKLEGSYVPKSLIRRHDPHGPACPTINEGTFFVDQRGSDWIIQRHVIREYGVVVHGPDPKTLIDPVSPDDIRQAVLGVLQEWWYPMLDNPGWLRQHESIYHAFAVITMCRALHAFQHGIIVSKPAAAKWAQAEFGVRRSTLIEKALASQHGDHPGFLDETLDFIRFTKEKIERHPPQQHRRIGNNVPV
jgi:hypothetical protein